MAAFQDLILGGELMPTLIVLDMGPEHYGAFQPYVDQCSQGKKRLTAKGAKDSNLAERYIRYINHGLRLATLEWGAPADHHLDFLYHWW